MSDLDLQFELQEANTRAYNLEQEVMRAELCLKALQKRVDELERENLQLRCVQIETTCDHCGKNFMHPKKGRTARFCSASCRQLHYKGNKEFSAAMAEALAH